MDLFKRACESCDVPWRPDSVEKLIVKHYRNIGRPLRRCHPRDLLHQVSCLCAYRGERIELRPEFLDLACTNYFGNQPIMQSSAAMVAKPVGWDIPNQNGQSVTAPKLVRPAPNSLRPQESQPVIDQPLRNPALNSQSVRGQPMNSQPMNSQPWRTEVIRNPTSFNGPMNPPLQPVVVANPNATPMMQVPRPTRAPALPDLTGTSIPTSERA